jgi:hypothetical protein
MTEANFRELRGSIPSASGVFYFRLLGSFTEQISMTVTCDFIHFPLYNLELKVYKIKSVCSLQSLLKILKFAIINCSKYKA